MHRALRLYFPSFLIRYSMQFTLIALPWVLQGRGIPIAAISTAVSFFHFGSLGSGLLAGRLIGRVKVRGMLRGLLLLQALLAASCFWSFNIPTLSALCLLQGATLGILRPLNQIWLLELEPEGSTVEQTARRSTYSQVVLALGMAVGAWLGAVVSGVSGSVFFGMASCLVPSLAGIFWLPPGPPPRAQGSTTVAAPHGLRAPITWLTRHVFAGSAVLLFLLSMVTFKVWIVGLPFHLRTQATGMPDGQHLVTLLGILLAVQPLVFAGGQFVAGRLVHRMPRTPLASVGLLLAANLAQAGMTWLAVWSGLPGWAMMMLVLVGGGLGPAIIYPLMMLMLMRQLREGGMHLYRQMMLLLSILADVGQLIGVALLALPSLTRLPLETLLLPVLLVMMASSGIALRYLLTRASRSCKPLTLTADTFPEAHSRATGGGATGSGSVPPVPLVTRPTSPPSATAATSPST
jgi:MFS family permease